MPNEGDEGMGSTQRYGITPAARYVWLCVFLTACIPDLGAVPEDASAAADAGPLDEGGAADADAGDDLLAQGERIFLIEAGGTGCDYCHGDTGAGDIGIGPNIRGRTFDEIKTSLRTVPEMDMVHLSDAEIEALVVYLQYLLDTFG